MRSIKILEKGRLFLSTALFITSGEVLADENNAQSEYLRAQTLLAMVTTESPLLGLSIKSTGLSPQELSLDIPVVSIPKPELDIALDLDLGAEPAY